MPAKKQKQSKATFIIEKVLVADEDGCDAGYLEQLDVDAPAYDGKYHFHTIENSPERSILGEDEVEEMLNTIRRLNKTGGMLEGE